MFGILIAYLLVIGTFIYGWKNYPETGFTKISTGIKVSIVIAVRNETRNVLKLIDSLSRQVFDINEFEVIFVDDNSVDDTFDKISDSIGNANLKIKLYRSKLDGKKAAIRMGVQKASYDLIITTDGDCQMGPNWLSSMIGYYQNSDKKVIIGPVTYDVSNRFISKLFTVEFASLAASGAGSAATGLPLMGNGANLAFEKKLFDDYDDRSDITASGDDVFLIHHSAVKYGNKSIGFVKNEEAIVSTPAPETIKKFFNQRVRWASKAGGYKLIWPIIVSMVVFLFNLQLSLVLLLGIYYNWLLPIFVLLILTKFMIDFPLVNSYLSFCGHKKLSYLLPVMEIIYPFYISIVSMTSFFGNFSWKGRKY